MDDNRLEQWLALIGREQVWDLLPQDARDALAHYRAAQVFAMAARESEELLRKEIVASGGLWQATHAGLVSLVAGSREAFDKLLRVLQGDWAKSGQSALLSVPGTAAPPTGRISVCVLAGEGAGGQRFEGDVLDWQWTPRRDLPGPSGQSELRFGFAPESGFDPHDVEWAVMRISGEGAEAVYTEASIGAEGSSCRVRAVWRHRLGNLAPDSVQLIVRLRGSAAATGQSGEKDTR